jgi:hypothetical protein
MLRAEDVVVRGLDRASEDGDRGSLAQKETQAMMVELSTGGSAHVGEGYLRRFATLAYPLHIEDTK